MGFSLPFTKKEQHKEHYFGLYLTHEHAVGFVFEILDGKASIIAKELCKYSNGWENILEDVDKLISILEAETNVHLNPSIFFVHSYMIEQETHELKTTYKDIIKNISKQLELKPLGYIEAHEAVKDHLEHRDESLLNMILVELDSIHVGMYVYKGGRLIFSEYVPRTSDLIDDVTHLMRKVHSNTLLPSKIVVYGMIKIDDKVEQLVHHKWNTDFFIQHPRIELLKGEELYTSLGSIFAQQMGAADMPEETYEKEPVMIKEEAIEQETFGFVIGKDITRETDIQPPLDEDHARPQNNGRKMPAFSFKNPFSGFKGISLKGMPFKMPAFLKTLSFPRFNYIWIVAILAVIGGFIAFEYYLHTAEIVVYVPSEKIEKEVDLTLPIGESEEMSLVVHAFSADVTEEKATTGKRDVGEKAKGIVTILNFDNAEKSFPAGTKLETSGLTFTTDSDIRIASASSVTTGGAKQAGKAKVSATAAAIGPESNIAENKQLKIAGLSDALYVAVVESAFKGGTRKQVQTVARKDLDALEVALTDKTSSEEGNVATNIEENQEVVESLTEVTVGDIEYSKEVAEEADIVSAKATTEKKVYTFDKEKMKKTLAEELKSIAPQGFTLEANKVTYSLNTAEKAASETATLQLQAQATVIKNVSPEALKKTIALSLTSGLEKKLQETFSAKGYEIKKTSPPFMGFWTPFFQKNVTVTITSR